MAVLIRSIAALVAVVAAAGCYDPQLEDCTVTCAGAGDCADDQVCGTDGFCAAPSVAGTCGPPAAMLHIRIEKKGRVVVVEPAFTCEASDNAGTTCVLPIARTGWTELRAEQTDKQFDRWTTTRCGGQPPTCRLMMGDDSIEVGARFD